MSHLRLHRTVSLGCGGNVQEVPMLVLQLLRLRTPVFDVGRGKNRKSVRYARYTEFVLWTMMPGRCVPLR